jgi:molybdate transport system substrate-binding protein
MDWRSIMALVLFLSAKVAMRDDWIIYAAFGVLVCLLLWRIATGRNSAEAGNRRASLIILGVVALVMVVWQGVRLLPIGATTAQDKTITVFAAASLTNALDDVDTAFTKQSGIKIVVSYGASSALARQIEQGAPADVFASADLQWMDHCARKKVDTRVNLLGNKLVLIAAKNANIDHVTIEPGFDLAKLAGDGRVATGDVREVPVGLYAKAALERLGAWEAVEPKMVMAGDVQLALSMVARREVPLGIVYETDAKIEPAVKVIGVFPDNPHDPIIYPVALTANAKPDAVQYLSFLHSQTAKSIFEKYGFNFLVNSTS